MLKKIKSVGDVLDKEKAFTKFRKSVREQDAVVEFENIFPELKKTVAASRVDKGVLFLTIENSVLRNEINLKKQLMINKINNYFNQKIIVDVKFTNFRTSK